MVRVCVLASLKTTARSGSVPPVKLLATRAEGLTPTVNCVYGHVTPDRAPANEAMLPVPRLPESKDSVTGKRSPTKNVAGLPSCARSRTWRPLCTSESESEKFAATLGRVSRKVERPPPKGKRAVVGESPFAAKTCAKLVRRLVRVVDVLSLL